MPGGPSRRACSHVVEVRNVKPDSPPGVSQQARTVARIGPGRGLFLTHAVKGGDVILVDDPVMIYVDEGQKRHTCAHCFRMQSGEKGELPRSCATCKQVWFCSTQCQEAAARATPGQGHSPQECALLHKMSGISKRLGGQEGITLARMLIKAALIKVHDTDRWRQLQDLCAPDGLEDHQCDWGMICLRTMELGGECSELGGAQARLMLQRDASNGMGILARKEPGQAAALRAGCLYGTCSMLNHACSPNVARFDDFDSPQEGNMRVIVKALSDMDAGTELRMNYLSILVGVEERQKRLLDEYGFKCECDRCYLEQLFPDDESDDEKEDSKFHCKNAPNEKPSHVPTVEEEDRRNALALWIAKFSCPEEDCGGTMAPVAEGGAAQQNGGTSKKRKLSDCTDDGEQQQEQADAEVLMECNRCGQVLRGLDRVYDLLE